MWWSVVGNDNKKLSLPSSIMLLSKKESSDILGSKNFAGATMCYFPVYNRIQGVACMNAEINLHFGRIKDDGNLNEVNDEK